MSFSLKQSNLKTTPARTAIITLLEKVRSPLPIDEIEKKLKSKNINQSTIYRTLNQFVEAGIAKRVDFGDNKAYFELTHEGDHHHHIVCIRCKKTEDVEECEVDDLEKKLLKKSKSFKEIRDHSLEFFGICKDCNKS